MGVGVQCVSVSVSVSCVPGVKLLVCNVFRGVMCLVCHVLVCQCVSVSMC